MKYSVSALLFCLLLNACGKSDAPAPEAPKAAAPVVAAAPAVDPGGEKTYKGTCALCHATGAGGAPIVGNKDEWAPRIAQGNDTLYKHAIEGFVGQKGAMPARGTGVSLTDAEVKAAVDYMLGKSH